MADLAVYQDLELSWRTLTADERIRATYKIGQASRYIRRHFPDVDERIVAGTLSAADVGDVVLAMVERAFPIRNGIQSKTETRGPFTETVRYFDASTGMYLTDEEEAILVGPAGAPAGAFSTRPRFTPDTHVPC